MAKGFTEPHVLLASSNPQKLINNLKGILTDVELQKIQNAVNTDIKGLFSLGISHHSFAQKIEKLEWRQRVSRLYYAAYNIKRAIQLSDSGVYSTDSSDHQKIDDLPNSLTNAATYKSKLKNMRDDRNLADYSHLGTESDLLIKPDDMQLLVSDFIKDSEKFLSDKGIDL